ncbi:cysteine/serine-rich nuclear protein 3 isoform X2 [Centruroides vittatus]|uniref:cysteine/serine-rich nuclear protein 3 isoform X2 n=1 Tax=Centruroides vittatus TaxID=120091 RepID=UPI00350F4F39
MFHISTSLCNLAKLGSFISSSMSKRQYENCINDGAGNKNDMENSASLLMNNKDYSNNLIDKDDTSNSSVQSDGCSEAPTTSTSQASADNSEIDEPPKKKRKKNVCFNGVTVYYFPRTQGFTCVPSQGGSTLGMDLKHCQIKKFSLQEHSEERKKVHRDILLQQRHTAKHQNPTSESEESEDISDISDSELEADSCYFLQPVPIRQRRAMLRASGVRRIDSLEKEECRDIRASREFCGCECKIYCDPDACSCSQAGIKCQVDRLSFPCGCTRDGCGNLSGRIEFNPLRVRTHFIHTLMRLKLEKEDQELLGKSMNTMLCSTSFASPSLPSYDGCNSITTPLSNCISFPSSCMPITPQNSNIEGTSCMLSNKREEPTFVSFGEAEKEYSNSEESTEMYGSPFSPEDSSYSENSDYSSDDFDSDHSVDTAHTQSTIQVSFNRSLNSNPPTYSEHVSFSKFQSTQNNAARSCYNNNNTSNTNNNNNNNNNGNDFNSENRYTGLNRHFENPQSQLQLQNSNSLNNIHEDNISSHKLLEAGSCSEVGLMLEHQHNIDSKDQYNICLDKKLSISKVLDNHSENACHIPEDEHSYTELSSAVPGTDTESYSGLLCSKVQDITAIKPVNLETDKANILTQNSNFNLNENGHKIDEVQTDRNEEFSENFGEIIKKTMVETVSA